MILDEPRAKDHRCLNTRHGPADPATIPHALKDQKSAVSIRRSRTASLTRPSLRTKKKKKKDEKKQLPLLFPIPSSNKVPRFSSRRDENGGTCYGRGLINACPPSSPRTANKFTRMANRRSSRRNQRDPAPDTIRNTTSAPYVEHKAPRPWKIHVDTVLLEATAARRTQTGPKPSRGVLAVDQTVPFVNAIDSYGRTPHGNASEQKSVAAVSAQDLGCVPVNSTSRLRTTYSRGTNSNRRLRP